jgi:hypothetical protein
MSFGKNPYVAKAQTAEQKAADALDDDTKARAYRDAAHQWERAATREGPGKRRDEYEQLADKNRRLANGEISADEEAELDLAAAAVLDAEPEGAEQSSPKLLDPKLLN